MNYDSMSNYGRVREKDKLPEYILSIDHCNCFKNRKITNVAKTTRKARIVTSMLRFTILKLKSIMGIVARG